MQENTSSLGKRNIVMACLFTFLICLLLALTFQLWMINKQNHHYAQVLDLLGKKIEVMTATNERKIEVMTAASQQKIEALRTTNIQLMKEKMDTDVNAQKDNLAFESIREEAGRLREELDKCRGNSSSVSDSKKKE